MKRYNFGNKTFFSFATGKDHNVVIMLSSFAFFDFLPFASNSEKVKMRMEVRLKALLNTAHVVVSKLLQECSNQQASEQGQLQQ